MKLTEVEVEMFAELTRPEHNPPKWDGWVNFDPDFAQTPLRRMLRNGWIERREIDGLGRPYREYRLTPAGRAALEASKP